MLVTVGGHTRNIGKTSVAAGLIRALPEANWTALKVTQHGHGVCAADGHSCDCAAGAEDHPFVISEETPENAAGDSGRFLRAGARRAYWVRTAMGQLGNAVPEIRRLLDGCGNAIVESNSLLQYFRPDLYIVVLAPAVEDFKESALRYLDRADAVVISGEDRRPPRWKSVAGRLWEDKPRFTAAPDAWVSPALASFVAGRMRSVRTATLRGR